MAVTDLPAGITYGRVRGRIILAVADGADVGDNPDASPAAGTITFTPELTSGLLLPDGVIVAPRPVVVTLEDGAFDEYLVATDSGNPAGWTYRVAVKVVGVTIQAVSIEVPTDADILLTELVPVPSSTGEPTLVGPPGEDGTDGADGQDGLDGRTIIVDSGPPDNADGVDGDGYLDRPAAVLYGPKAGGVWGVGVSLVGPPGADSTVPGPQGDPGSGSVDTVNGDPGPDVVLDANDVGAVPAGQGLPAGGAAYTVLAKTSNADYATGWTALPVDGIASAPTLRTLGTGAQQAAAGNHGHAIADIADLVAQLLGKADLVSGKVPTSQIPSISTHETVPVASKAAMLALTSSQVQPGDVAVIGSSAVAADRGLWLLTAAADPSVLGNWTHLDIQSGVTSIQGQTGVVVLGAADVGARPAGDVPWTEVSGKPSTFTPAAHQHAAGDVTSGVFSTARLGTGTADSTKVLKGDGTWGTAGGGGGLLASSSWRNGSVDVTTTSTTFVAVNTTNAALTFTPTSAATLFRVSGWAGQGGSGFLYMALTDTGGTILTGGEEQTIQSGGSILELPVFRLSTTPGSPITVQLRWRINTGTGTFYLSRQPLTLEAIAS